MAKKKEEEVKKPTIQERIKDLEKKRLNNEQQILMLDGAIQILKTLEKEGYGA